MLVATRYVRVFVLHNNNIIYYNNIHYLFFCMCDFDVCVCLHARIHIGYHKENKKFIIIILELQKNY